MADLMRVLVYVPGYKTPEEVLEATESAYPGSVLQYRTSKFWSDTSPEPVVPGDLVLSDDPRVLAAYRGRCQTKRLSEVVADHAMGGSEKLGPPAEVPEWFTPEASDKATVPGEGSSDPSPPSTEASSTDEAPNDGSVWALEINGSWAKVVHGETGEVHEDRPFRKNRAQEICDSLNLQAALAEAD